MYCPENIKRSLKYLKENNPKIEYWKYIEEFVIEKIESKFWDKEDYEKYFFLFNLKNDSQAISRLQISQMQKERL